MTKMINRSNCWRCFEPVPDEDFHVLDGKGFCQPCYESHFCVCGSLDINDIEQGMCDACIDEMHAECDQYEDSY